jgi:hypothetical protein
LVFKFQIPQVHADISSQQPSRGPQVRSRRGLGAQVSYQPSSTFRCSCRQQ